MSRYICRNCRYIWNKFEEIRIAEKSIVCLFYRLITFRPENMESRKIWLIHCVHSVSKINMRIYWTNTK